MKLKLDENLGSRCVQLLVDAGHEVATVTGQQLCSASDDTLIDLCRKEERCLITLDLDFGNPLLFKPSQYTGIAIVRLPRKYSLDDLLGCVRALIQGLETKRISGKLWIVQREHIREYQEEME